MHVMKKEIVLKKNKINYNSNKEEKDPHPSVFSIVFLNKEKLTVLFCISFTSFLKPFQLIRKLTIEEDNFSILE